MNRNIMIQTLRRFKVTSGYKGYYYLLDAADIISGFHTKEKPFATQNDIYIPIGEKHETSFYNVERGIRVVVDKCWKEDKELMMEILVTMRSSVQVILNFWMHLHFSAKTGKRGIFPCFIIFFMIR